MEQRENNGETKISERLEAAVLKFEQAVNPPLMRRFINGVVTGFGTVIGATILVSLAVWMLKPLMKIEALSPALDRIADAVERGERKQ